jgi:hypothetical protein
MNSTDGRATPAAADGNHGRGPKAQLALSSDKKPLAASGFGLQKELGGKDATAQLALFEN